jgi:selenide, water dikinase
MGADALAHVLRPLEGYFAGASPDLLVGLGAADDAAVYRLNDEQAVVATLDFFPPIVDDAATFGAIAAANALSDLYAMGAMPLLALNVAAFPDDLDPEILTDILRGGAEKVREAGAVVAGGHTVTDKEPKFGLVALGLVHPQQIFTKGGARSGDALILTKPLGTGTITTALKNGAEGPEFEAALTAAVASMTTLNAAATRALRSVAGGVHACTDITGFGLLGHALEMAQQSGVALRFDLGAIPWLPGARALAAARHTPGGTGRNQRAVTPHVVYEGEVSKVDRLLLCDPQTSGGLFAAIAPERLEESLSALRAEGVTAAVIGRAEAGAGLIVSATPAPGERRERAATRTAARQRTVAVARAPGKQNGAAVSEAASDPVAALEAALGYTFRNRQLPLDALTHTSYTHEFAGPGVVSNERLEFLGDAALALVSAGLLYQLRPDASEGDLSQLRAALVRASTLASLARAMRLGSLLRLGRGEDATGGRDRDLLIASAFEAVIGALYLDAGLEAVRAWLEPLLRAEAGRAVEQRRVKDAKSLLQELAQARLGVTPRYQVVSEEGPSHARLFNVQALLGDVVIGAGQGLAKREAEQAAARAALADPGWGAADTATGDTTQEREP